jgi:hypothetical protein
MFAIAAALVSTRRAVREAVIFGWGAQPARSALPSVANSAILFFQTFKIRVFL